eukprot:9467508-Pyramimonas_sp.AAC.1
MQYPTAAGGMLSAPCNVSCAYLVPRSCPETESAFSRQASASSVELRAPPAAGRAARRRRGRPIATS